MSPKTLRDINVTTEKNPRSNTKEVISDYKGQLKQMDEPLTYEEAVQLRLGLICATSSLGFFVPAIHALHASRFKLPPYHPPLQPTLNDVFNEQAPELAPSTEVILDSSMPQPLAGQLDLSLKDQNVKNRVVREGIMNSIRFSRQDRRDIERGTRGQKVNIVWYHQRMGSITSCQIDEIHRSSLPGSRISTDRLASTCIGKRYKYMVAPPRTNKAPLKWGTSHEDEARNLYLQWAHALEAHRNVCVNQTGLLIHPTYSFIRASPDGIITCDCCKGKRILEIKCPYSAREANPSAGVDSGQIEYLERYNGVKCGDFILSKTKRGYYSQVQCTMAAAGAKSCDFFVWTTESFLVVPVDFDADHWMRLVSSAMAFFRDKIIPSIAGGSPGELDEKDHIYEEDHTLPTDVPTPSKFIISKKGSPVLADVDMNSSLTSSTTIPVTVLPIADRSDVQTYPKIKTDQLQLPPIEATVLPHPATFPKVDTDLKHDDSVYRCCSCGCVLPEEEYVADDNADASVGCECRCVCDMWSCWKCAAFKEEMQEDGESWFCAMCTAICDMAVE